MNRETSKSPARSWLKVWLMAALLLMASSLAVRAQDESVPPFPCEDTPCTAVQGTISDCAGAPLAGVTVRIEGPVTRIRTTNASGFYSAFLLPEGEYTVTPITIPVGFFYSPRNIVTEGGGASFTRYRRDNRANFDGDCRTDISNFHRGTGEWRSINSSDGQTVSFFFGTTADIATPGDYNGDGKTDRSVFRPSNGTWYVATDTSGAFYGVQWGTTGDIPVARDYDGDGKTDHAVFRPGNATWYILRSSDSGVEIIQFGVTGDRVVPGDYNGDNKDDLAVYRPSTQTWYIRHPDGNFHGVPFGLVSDWPAQADYDGDGITDIAVFRPGPGDWHVLYSSNGGVESLHWGASGDRPVPGDYDGDGRANIAVQRPDSEGVWWILLDIPTGSHYGVSFQPAVEFPVPAGYLTPLF